MNQPLSEIVPLIGHQSCDEVMETLRKKGFYVGAVSRFDPDYGVCSLQIDSDYSRALVQYGRFRKCP